MANGVGTLSRLLSLTLGPHTSKVLVENNSRSRAGDHLDDGLTLSQRVLELPDPFEDMGSQILRKALTSVGARSHDGTATCSAITHAVLRSAEPMLASGYEARQFSDELAKATEQVMDELNRRAMPIDTMEEVEAVLRSALVEPALATVIAEIVDTVGADGAVKVEESRLPVTAHEYVQGGRWTTKLASPYLLDPSDMLVTAHKPVILVATAPIVNLEYIMPAFEAAASTTTRNLILVAPKFSDRVISALLMNRERGILNTALAILAPTSVHFKEQILEDIGLLVGCESSVLHSTGTSRKVQKDDLGSAAEVWVSSSAFGVVGGNSNARALAARLRALHNQLMVEENAARKRQLNERVGTLQGISAIIRVPDRTAAFGEENAKKVEKALAIAHQAIKHGVLPGGGAALAHCAANIEGSEDLGPGSRVLLQSIREPMSVILANSGYTPGPIQHQLGRMKWHETFDVVNGNWVDSREVGLFDSLISVRTALATAVSAALMVISTDTLVSRKPAHHFTQVIQV